MMNNRTYNIAASIGIQYALQRQSSRAPFSESVDCVLHWENPFLRGNFSWRLSGKNSPCANSPIGETEEEVPSSHPNAHVLIGVRH